MPVQNHQTLLPPSPFTPPTNRHMKGLGHVRLASSYLLYLGLGTEARVSRGEVHPMKRHERCPVFPTSVGHIPGLSGHNGLARDDPMRDVPGQSWDILRAGVD